MQYEGGREGPWLKLGIFSFVDTGVLGLLLDVAKLGSSHHKNTFGQVGGNAVVVNVVADAEALLEFGDTRLSVAMDFTLAHDM